MTIEEAKHRKISLQIDVNKMLVEFQKETGLNIEIKENIVQSGGFGGVQYTRFNTIEINVLV